MESPGTQIDRTTSSSAKKDGNLPWRCLQKSLTTITFGLSLFSGLSLSMAGLFKERIGHEDLDSGATQYKSAQVGLIGLVIVAYSIIGFCLCCSKGLHQRVSWHWNIA